MKKGLGNGFYTLLIAQFLSAVADNALLFAAIALLHQLQAPSWHEPLLREFLKAFEPMCKKKPMLISHDINKTSTFNIDRSYSQEEASEKILEELFILYGF